MLGYYHKETASAYKNIAGIYYSLKQIPFALENYNHALQILMKLYGEHNAETQIINFYIALSYY